MAEGGKPHLFLKDVHSVQKYTQPPRNFPPKPLVPKNRQAHSDALIGQLNDIWDDYASEINQREAKYLPQRNGEYLVVESTENSDLKLDTFNSVKRGSHLLKVELDGDRHLQRATIFIDEDKRDDFLKPIIEFRDENIVRNGEDTGKPRNGDFVLRIETFKKATFTDLWSSPVEFIPNHIEKWIEIWVRIDGLKLEQLKLKLSEICESLNIQIGDKEIVFPEIAIFSVKANESKLTELVKSFDFIAEFRQPDELNTFWIGSTIIDREDWIEEALKNCVITGENNYISILDSGVNNGHKLLSPFLHDDDKLTVNEEWGKNDNALDHGTRMAGVALYGRLERFLEREFEINHRLESMKIFPNDGYNEEDQLPVITENAVNLTTVSNPEYKRIYCFANTSKYNYDFGRPSTWSAVIDKLVFGRLDDSKKLFVISAGNLRSDEDYLDYPEGNYNGSVESPAQSWNAITIGAYTTKTLPDFQTVAKSGEISPFSRTSYTWENSWPIKPEVVFEGGNLKKNSDNTFEYPDDLSILTTSRMAVTNKLTTINATSAATAFGANFLAILRSNYPDAWEETLRGLMIHSASWTDEMKNQLEFDSKQTSIQRMLRMVGYGVPNLEKAVSSKTNYLTIISEETIQPYKLESGKGSTNEAFFYELPWPKEALQDLGELGVTLRVTLSYFIEPNPGEKSYSSKYSYQSCALKFILMNPNDEPDNFILSINNAARKELKEAMGLGNGEKLPDDAFSKVSSIDWALGADNVFKGSIHSNYWETSAANLAGSNYLAIVPQASGWWKNLKKQKKHSEKLRFSLIVSIETESTETDIYNVVRDMVRISDKIKV